VLGLRRGGQTLDVEINLEVMGSYSPTAPYDCPKTDKIVADLEKWLAKRGGAGENFLSTDTLFLLGAGSPEYQGLVRRYIYRKLIDFKQQHNNWYLGFDSMLLAEYYLATGDRNVLPALERMAANIAAHQIGPDEAKGMTGRIGGWYGKGKKFRNYPTMPPAGMACMIGLTLADRAGAEIDKGTWERGVAHFRHKGAPVGQVIYGDAYRDTPLAIDPEEMLAGRLSSDNGKISVAGILFDLIGDVKTAYVCSLISTHAYNHTYPGHGGNFWNNFWTPLGSNVHGKPAFRHFMEGHRWYRELNRMFDGGLIINEGQRVGAGHGLALVVPRARLQILGGPMSPFAADAPAFLQPARDAYFARDYARAESLTEELLESNVVGKKDRLTVEKLLEEARRIQASIQADLDRMKALAEQGRVHEARLDIPQLEGVMPEDDPRLAAIKKTLAEAKARPDDRRQYETAQKEIEAPTARLVVDDAAESIEWRPLTTEIMTGGKGEKNELGKVEDPAEATKWRLKVIESRDQAPDDWMNPDFDDASWDQTALPQSWHLNHTALLRTTFNVEDLESIDRLRFRAWLFRQQDIEIYLNGKLIGKVNNLKKKTGDVDAVFQAGAVKHLKKGENSLAIVTRNNWRWGMLFMKVYNAGFGFRLDAGQQTLPDGETGGVS
ncbi:MAG: DUF6288 domain-containing protein, partial [Phycisphaeraceae bacterium]|nr:DUF6288 domain-containing protein [Phycisphaeraceae bacterium]